MGWEVGRNQKPRYYIQILYNFERYVNTLNVISSLIIPLLGFEEICILNAKK
jgi:hypothetical protein